jgi:phospholipid/cholesterol/gamma-HCH transport system ATP-binding protein
MSQSDPYIEISNLTMAYGDNVIQKDLDFTINRGDIFIIMGGSGCGKEHTFEAFDRSYRTGPGKCALQQRKLLED